MSFYETEIELPLTQIQAQISLYEANRGTTRTLAIKDPSVCLECVDLDPSRARKCSQCRGLGYTHIYRQVEVEFPSGLLNDVEIRYPGLGLYNLCAGKNSDLIVKIKICRHPYLELSGKNITCTLVVPFLEAMLGKSISVPTVAGKAMIKLHPLTLSGKTYKLKGHGLAGGDQLINIEVSSWPKIGKTPAGGRFCVGCAKVDDADIQTLSLPNLNSAASWVV